MFIKTSQCRIRMLHNTETDLRHPIKKLANGPKCFPFRGAKLWNCLSVGSKQAATLNAFKASI